MDMIIFIIFCVVVFAGRCPALARERFLQDSALHPQGNFLKKVSLTFKNFWKWVL